MMNISRLRNNNRTRGRDLVTTLSMTAAALLALSSMDQSSSQVQAFSFSDIKLPGLTSSSFRRTLGEPVQHAPVQVPADCLKYSADDLEKDKAHPCHPKRLEAVYYPGGKSKIDAPIIGVLTQPYGYGSKAEENDTYSSDDLEDSFIATSHVSFLEAAGARVVPVNYRSSYNQLIGTLKQINGIYIPGDSALILQNKKYMATLSTVYEWAQDQNVKSTNHFPIMAVSYGFLAMIKPYLYEEGKYLENLPVTLIDQSVPLNLRSKPADSFLYDDFTLKEADDMLDTVNFYNELNQGIRLGNFLKKQKPLARVFSPILTFHNDRNDQNLEFVAAIEGSDHPIWGIAFSIEKIQHNIDMQIEEKVDHGRKAVAEAQRIANFFVDEARLSGHKYRNRKEEAAALIDNFDAMIAEKDVQWTSNSSNKIMEVYLFK